MKNIVDFIIRLKNGYLAKKETITVPYSKTIEKILMILKKENFIDDFILEESGKKKSIKVNLKYSHKMPMVTDVKIFSKPGRRLYVKANSLKPVLAGKGIAILSTPKGILTDKEARKLKVGGELWFHIW